MKRVLLVDDDADSRDLYARYLDEEGFDVSVASDGAEAVALASAVPPDAIVMDVSMPGMGGPEAAWRLRGGDTTATIPIVALTAEPLADVEGSSFDTMLEKPYPPPALAELLTELMTAATTATIAAAPAAAISATPDTTIDPTTKATIVAPADHAGDETVTVTRPSDHRVS